MSLIRKGLTIGIMLSFVGLIIVIPYIDAIPIDSLSNEFTILPIELQRLFDENRTNYKFCFIESGDVQHRNFGGKFLGVPTSFHDEIAHLGIGTFILDLLSWNGNNDIRLKISSSHTITEYRQDVRIYVKTLIGFFQPTGHLSGGVLSGFAVSVKIYPLPLSNHTNTSISTSIFGSYPNHRFNRGCYGAILNTGIAPAYNLSYRFTITGGFNNTINKSISSTTSILPAKKMLKCGFEAIYGFGPITIILISSARNAKTIIKKVNGFQFGSYTWIPFSWIIPPIFYYLFLFPD